MRALVLLTALVLVGCASTQPLMVKVPVPIPCPARHLPVKPVLPIYSLNENSAPSDVMKAYVASVYLQNRWIDEVRMM